MRNPGRPYHRLAAIIIFAILSTSCVNRATAPSVTVSYSPPLLPIEIVYELTTGQIKVMLSGKISTPLGTFKASFGASSVAKRYNGVRTLTIITGTIKYVYELEHGRPYSIKLPSDENGQTEVRYSGTDDNLEINIPNPTGMKPSPDSNSSLRTSKKHTKLRAEPSVTQESGTLTQPELPKNVEPFQIPTPLPRQVLNTQECQELIAQYSPEKFSYIPPECQDMFRAYQDYLRQKEQERQQDIDDQERRDDAERQRKDDKARKRRQQVERWSTIIEGIVRRRRG